MVRKGLRGMANLATLQSMGQAFDAVWYEDSHCTPESRKKLILSDLMSASYRILDYHDLSSVLVALTAVKYSKYKFSEPVWGDEFIFDPQSQYFVKFGFRISQDKQSMQAYCRFRSSLDDRRCFTVSSTYSPKHVRPALCYRIMKLLGELEAEYSAL